MTVQRPSPESSTKPDNCASFGILRQRHRGEIEQPGADDAAAPPDLGDVRQVELEALVLRQLFGGRAAQDVEAFGIGLHQAVLDAVVDHLDEMAGAARAAMHVAALDARIAASRGPGVRGMSPAPGASAAKIGSR